MEVPGQDRQTGADDADGEFSVAPTTHQEEVVADITGLREAHRIVETDSGSDANAGEGQLLGKFWSLEKVLNKGLYLQ